MSGLVIQGLSKAFGSVAAVTDFALEVPRGGRAAIVGASGSGKTTVLRAVAGFETPDAGVLTIDGEVVGDGTSILVPAHRRGVGYVAQDGALFPHLTVGQNVAFGMDRRARTPAVVGELLELVGLDRSLGDRRPDQLSGGQQQRVALARALAVRPRVMLLDEPFSALDADARVSTRRSVTKVLQDAGITAILVTHDPDDARAFAGWVAVMHEGRLIDSGPPSRIFGSAIAE